MSHDHARGEGGSGLRGLIGLGRRLLGEGGEVAPAREADRRSGKRVPLRLPVHACVAGGKYRESKIIDVSLRGLAIEPGGDAEPGQQVAIRFPTSPAGVPCFMLQGSVARILGERQDALGIHVSHTGNPREALESYRRLVLYYLRHKPLLEEINTGYFEARCVSCDWVGRVGTRSPRCSACGDRVKRL